MSNPGKKVAFSFVGKQNTSARNTVRGLLMMTFLFLSTAGFSQGTISGRCTDKNGVPLKGVQVTTIQFDDRHTTETDGDGYYEDKNLAPGEWTVMYVYHSQKVMKKVAVKDATTKLDMNIIFSIDDKQKK